AVARATSDLDRDANVNVKALGRTPPACAVKDPRAINACALAREGPLVIAFMATRSDRCIRQIDLLNGLQARFPSVRFIAIAIRGGRSDLMKLVLSHGWTLPVGYDRDGAVANAYAVAVCPTITFARRGG